MAGDWLKICKDTPSKPEILTISARLNIHPDIAFARCFQLWSWFDSNTKNGVTNGVTKVTLDALLNREGLCDSLISVGWLIEENGDISLPNFDRHNSESAKSRADTNLRVARHRRKKNDEKNTPRYTERYIGVTKTLPEKRREEKRIKSTITTKTENLSTEYSRGGKKNGKTICDADDEVGL